jgi:hypothetical protein
MAMAHKQRTRRSRRRWPICPATGKQRLGERKDGTLALRAARQRRAEADRNQASCSWLVCRVYRCDDCHGWHMTSMPIRSGA